jgi:hypothetical protein
LIKAGGVISGIAAALFGHSPSTPAKEGQKSSSNNWNSVAAAGAVFFSAVLVFELSRAFDWAVLPDSVSLAVLTYFHLPSYWMHLVVAAGILSLWAVVASVFINVNKFSLHTYYRNRLIRCYLGASNKDRWPNAFTGFDEGDNLKMAELLPDKPPEDTLREEKLFHVISITLNLVHGKRLAWQERKATSFTVSPLAAGNPHVRYRRAEKYGDKISLGTAMAISGAAASPNMGYHSSPPLALLMTLFNVRLIPRNLRRRHVNLHQGGDPRRRTRRHLELCGSRQHVSARVHPRPVLHGIEIRELSPAWSAHRFGCV